MHPGTATNRITDNKGKTLCRYLGQVWVCHNPYDQDPIKDGIWRHPPTVTKTEPKMKIPQESVRAGEGLIDGLYNKWLRNGGDHHQRNQSNESPLKIQ